MPIHGICNCCSPADIHKTPLKLDNPINTIGKQSPRIDLKLDLHEDNLVRMRPYFEKLPGSQRYQESINTMAQNGSKPISAAGSSSRFRCAA
jgi:hypothetical protein